MLQEWNALQKFSWEQPRCEYPALFHAEISNTNRVGNFCRYVLNAIISNGYPKTIKCCVKISNSSLPSSPSPSFTYNGLFMGIFTPISMNLHRLILLINSECQITLRLVTSNRPFSPLFPLVSSIKSSWSISVSPLLNFVWLIKKKMF